MNVDKIPVAFTPSGGWTGEMPPPALAGCDALLGGGTVDIRVPLRAVRVTIDGEIQADRQMLSDAQRIEQADDQVTIAAGGLSTTCAATAPKNIEPPMSLSSTSRRGSSSSPPSRTVSMCFVRSACRLKYASGRLVHRSQLD
ncbi:MAG: hypothetical protein P8M10_09315 [Ilumatobacter sp.]|nr:hypothetical protein [Ilumatobacter sp.]MDG1696220.1 hypothetical protein [Ilumatobacter sp.]MDG2439504.1 hypothetical protein [Ilumatobacter sp.]